MKLSNRRSRLSPALSTDENIGEPREEPPEFEKAYALSRNFCEALEAIEEVKENCGEHDLNDSDDVSGTLRENTFLFCDVGWNDLALLHEWRKSMMHYGANESIVDEEAERIDEWLASQRLAVAEVEENGTPPVLEFIGKQKKGGMFWKTPMLGKGFLLKSVKSNELAVLKNWIPMGTIAREYVDCEAFKGTLLQPVLLFFLDTSSGVNYILMRDETMRLQEAAGAEWDVMKKWDIKPLPNLSDDLPHIIEALLKESKGHSLVLHLWEGWASVRESLVKSVNVLEHAEVVDYSLFIHLLMPNSENVTQPQSLNSNDGCIFQPQGGMIICIKIIDFLTPLTFLRGIESFGKGEKFNDYAGKFISAFDCLGDLVNENCHAYAAYASVKLSDGTSDTPALAFVRSSLFGSHYECKVGYPVMAWYSVMTNGPAIKFSSPDIGTIEAVEWKYPSRDYHRKLAEWLQAAASGGAVVKVDFQDLLRNAYTEQKQAAAQEVGTTHPMPMSQLAHCEDGIRKFATQSWWFRGDTNTELQNVLWHELSKDIFVARNKPRLSSHGGVVIEMRRKLCFLDTRLFSCRPAGSSRVQTNYTTTFGGIEILQVRSGHLSVPDYKPWANFTLGSNS